MDVGRAWIRIQDTVRRHPVLGDVLLAVGVAIMLVGILVLDPQPMAPRPPITTDVVGALLAVLAIAARRRFNLIALVTTVITASTFLIMDGREQPILTGVIALLLYTYAIRNGRRAAWRTAGAIAAVLLVVGILWRADGGYNVGMIAWVGLGTALGDATRSRRAYVAEVEERARRAEQSREEEARMRVIRERMRIARELHDMVAHHIAVIKVQASGAKHILAHRPDLLAPTLDHISRSSDVVLKEMAVVVGLLRNSPDHGTSTVDTPGGLARLPELLADLATVGLRIEHRQTGETRELPALVDLAAYRIAQEALTNAQKYGNGTACLTITYAEDTLTVDVKNTIGDRRTRHGSGYGIVGMRERVTANGGSFAAGPSGPNGFTVHAELPAPAVEVAQ